MDCPSWHTLYLSFANHTKRIQSKSKYNKRIQSKSKYTIRIQARAKYTKQIQTKPEHTKQIQSAKWIAHPGTRAIYPLPTISNESNPNQSIPNGSKPNQSILNQFNHPLNGFPILAKALSIFCKSYQTDPIQIKVY